jgi:hypothetical protein
VSKDAGSRLFHSPRLWYGQQMDQRSSAQAYLRACASDWRRLQEGRWPHVVLAMGEALARDMKRLGTQPK